MNQYKGFSGGIKAIQCSSASCDALVAACGLDRFLRVYTMQPPKLLHQVYLKLQCNCLLLSESVGGDGGQPDDEFELGHRTGIETGEDSEGSSGDELWNGMQTVGTKRAKAQTASSTKRTKLL